MTLPHHLEPVDAICPFCWETFGIPGSVQAVRTADGLELYRVCRCGCQYVGAFLQQGGLFAASQETPNE